MLLNSVLILTPGDDAVTVVSATFSMFTYEVAVIDGANATVWRLQAIRELALCRHSFVPVSARSWTAASYMGLFVSQFVGSATPATDESAVGLAISYAVTV